MLPPLYHLAEGIINTKPTVRGSGMRLQHGLSQYKLVEKMQLLGSTMSRSTYSKIELGAGNLKVSDLIALKQIYNADYAEFFEGISIDEKENE